MTDESLASNPIADNEAAPNTIARDVVAAATGLAANAVETLLSFEEIMSSARRVRRTAWICLRGDLEERRNEILTELAGLVDEDGNIVSEGEEALADQSQATALLDELKVVDGEMQTAMRKVVFEAMPEDEWEAFEKANRKPSGEAKDYSDYKRKLIARCAVEPTFTEQQVRQMQGKLGPSQLDEMFNRAFESNMQGGIDIPKLPSFLLAQKPA